MISDFSDFGKQDNSLKWKVVGIYPLDKLELLNASSTLLNNSPNLTAKKIVDSPFTVETTESEFHSFQMFIKDASKSIRLLTTKDAGLKESFISYFNEAKKEFILNNTKTLIPLSPQRSPISINSSISDIYFFSVDPNVDTVKSKIINYENVYNLILNYLEKRGLSYVQNNVSYINSLKNIQNFDAHLRKALLYDLYSSNLKNIKPESRFISFFEKYHVYKNSVTLQNDLYKYINSILYITSSLEELYSFEVINEIKNLEDGSFFTYKNEDFEIFVEFLQNKNSSIQIFIREDLI